MIRALLDPSLDARICKRLVDRFGRDGAKQALSAICKQFSNVEKAALALCVNEAWAMLACVAFAGLMLVPFARDRNPPG